MVSCHAGSLGLLHIMCESHQDSQGRPTCSLGKGQLDEQVQHRKVARRCASPWGGPFMDAALA